MDRVVVSAVARRDLVAIREYIRDELENPDAARDTLLALREAIGSLREMPERGIPLDSVLAVHTEYRFLLCRHYKVFYRYDAQGSRIEVVRVLHTLQDYMRALFS